MKIVWVPLCVALIIVSVDAQRSFNVSKPVVSLEKRPRPMAWLRPAAERRKLSIFPKTDMKFVVTPTEVKNEETEATSAGLPSKRPLMRKLIIHDNNDKNSWYFAPREPLMKTTRFTVTMAPPKRTEIRDSKYSNPKPEGEISVESKKVNTIINNTKSPQGLNKVPINKGNLINASRNKNVYVAPSKSNGRVNKLNDKGAKNKQTNVTIVNNSSFVSRDHDYETRTNKNVYVAPSKSNGRVNKLNDKGAKNKQTNVTIVNNSSLVSRDHDDETRTNKNVYVAPSKSNGRVNKLNDKGAKNKQTNVTIVNNSSLVSRDHDDETRTNNAKTEVNTTDLIKTEDVNESSTISQLVTPSNIEETISAAMKIRSSDLSDAGDQKEERALNFDVEGSKGNFDGSSNINLLEILMDNIMNDTASFNDDVSLSAHMYDSNIKLNQPNTKIMENIPQELYMETNKINHVTAFSNANISSTEGFQIVGNEEDNSGKDMLINIKQEKYSPSYLHILKSPVESHERPSETNYGNTENYTEHHGSKNPFEIATRAVEADLPELPTENFSENFENSVTENIIFQTTFENIKVEDASVGHGVSSELFSSEVSNTNEFNDEFKIDELMPVTEVSNLLFNLSEETKEDVSNEPLYDKSSNLTNEDDSNESYLIGEDISSESVGDKLNNYTDEVSNEMEREHNLSGEIVSNDSNMAGEEISNESISYKSNESMIDQSTNYTDEESNLEKANNLTGEEISNESNIAGEEISNKSAENSNNLTEEILNSESLIDTSLTVEDLSEEIVKDISDEFIRSFKPRPSFNSKHALPKRFKRNSNVIEEELKATTVSGLKYTGHEVRLGHSLNYKNINA